MSHIHIHRERDTRTHKHTLFLTHPIQITGAMFAKLKKIAEMGLESNVVDCVISCPPYWTEAERRAILDAANIAGLNVLRLMNETTAAALNYGILRPLPKDQDIKVAFVDVGASSTNVTIAAFQQGKLQILGTASDAYLGGRNFDWKLMEHFNEHIKKNYKGLDPMSEAKPRFKLQKECQRIKTVLSANNTTQFNVEYIMNDTDVKGQVTRAEFEEMSAPLLERFSAPVQLALERAGVDLSNLHSVEVIGGATRIPMVQAALKKVFGQELSKTCDSDESVARGCALQCAMLSPSFRVREFEVQDIAPYAVEMSWGPIDQEAPDSATLLFTVGNPVPSVKMISFKDRADSFQLSARYADPSQLRPGTPAAIGRWVVSGLPKDQDPSKVRIKVRVKMSLHGVLSVRSAQLLEELPEEPEAAPMEDEASKPASEADAKPMEDEATPEADAKPEDAKDDAAKDNSKVDAKDEEKKKVKVKRVDLAVAAFLESGLSEAVLTNKFEREAQMANQDKVIAETNELRNTLESYCLEMRNKLQNELSAYVEKAAGDKFCEELTTNEDWLYDDGFDAQKSEYKKRVDALMKIGDPIVFRFKEEESRAEHVAGFKTTLTQYQQLAASTDEKYSHIEAEERAKVTAKCAEFDAWFVEVQGKQDRTAKHEDPVFTCKGLQSKARELSTFCNSIMNKPKPAPKVEEKPKEEPKAEEPKAEAGDKMEDEAPAAEAAADAEAAPKAEDASMQMD